METKSPLKSKTLWTNFLLAAGALFFPPFNEWAGANPEMLALAFSGVNMLLRLVTKDQISLS